MNFDRLTPWIALCAGAGVVLAIGMLSTTRPQAGRAETVDLLWQLERECHPDAVSNNYEWSSTAPPTEKHRRLILERFHELHVSAASEVARMVEKGRRDEFGEMLIVLAAALGDQAMITPAAKLMAYSEHPAVRLCAARELRKLKDPKTVEWFEYAAINDDRCVRNDGCGRAVELFYPVRTEARLALQELTEGAQ